MPYSLPPDAQQVLRDRWVVPLSPFSSPFGFSRVIPSLELRPEQWNVSYAPACSGVSMLFRAGMQITDSLSPSQVSELQRTVFTFRPDGAEVGSFEVCSEVEEMEVVGICHLRGTGHLVVAFTDGTVRVFTLDGAQLREFDATMKEDGKALVTHFAGAGNSLAFLLSNGSVNYVENLDGRVLNQKTVRIRKIRADTIRGCVGQAWPLPPNEISFLKIIPSSAGGAGSATVVIATDLSSKESGLYFFSTQEQDAGRGCFVSDLARLAGLGPEGPGGEALALPETLHSAVVHSEGSLLLAQDRDQGVICLLDIRRVRKAEAEAPSLLMLVPTNSPGSEVQIALCGGFPCFYDGANVVLCARNGRSPVAYTTREFLEPGLFVMNSLDSGCEYYVCDEDTKSYGQLALLSQSFCGVYQTAGSKPYILVDAYVSSQEAQDVTQADRLMRTLLPDQGAAGDAGGEAAGGAAGGTAGSAAGDPAGSSQEPKPCLLADVVKAVLSAARSACAAEAQAELLGAAAYGKVFAPPSHQIELTADYDSTRKMLRVVNTLCGPETGFAVTPEEFGGYAVQDMIRYLAARGDFPRAFGLAEFYFPKPATVENLYRDLLIHYGLSVALNPKNNRYTDGELYTFISAAISRFPEIRGVSRSLVDVLLHSEGTKRLQLIRQLVDCEPSVRDKVELFGEMGDYPLAVRSAVSSGNSDLLYAALNKCFVATSIPDPTLDVVEDSFREIFGPPLLPGEQASPHPAAADEAGPGARSPQLTLADPQTSAVLCFYRAVVAENSAARKKHQLLPQVADIYWDSLETLKILAGVVGEPDLAVEAILRDILISWDQIVADEEAKERADSLISVTTQDSNFKPTCDMLRSLTDYISSLSALQSGHQKKKRATLEAPPPVLNVCDLFRHFGRAALSSVAEAAASSADRDGSGTGLGSATLSYSACGFSGEIKKAVSSISKACGLKPEMLHAAVVEGIVEEARRRAGGTAQALEQPFRFADEYVRQALGKAGLAAVGGHLAELLVEASPSAAERSGALGYLCGAIPPREAAKVAARTGNAKLFAEALAAMPGADLEIFQIAAGSLAPELRQALVEAQSQK